MVVRGFQFTEMGAVPHTDFDTGVLFFSLIAGWLLYFIHLHLAVFLNLT